MFTRIEKALDKLATSYQKAITPRQWRKRNNLLDYSMAARVMLLKRHSQYLIKRHVAIACILLMALMAILRQIFPDLWLLWSSVASCLSVIEMVMIRILSKKRIANGISGYEVLQMRKKIARVNKRNSAPTLAAVNHRSA